jgi:putative ABC transport system permease protein
MRLLVRAPPMPEICHIDHSRRIAFSDRKRRFQVVVAPNGTRNVVRPVTRFDRKARTTTDSEIIGVVGDVRDHGLDQAPEPRLYGSILQRSSQLFAVFLRTSANLTTTRQLVTRTMEQIDRELPVYGVTTMNELVSNSMARRRLALFLMSTFAALALFLASLGIYGVTAFLVKQRVQEFGIRMALGAQIRDILVLAVRPGLVLVSIGAAAGVVVSMFVTRVMSSLLFAVSSTDLFTFITVPLVLAVIAVIACLIPARYATRISPAEALRHT